MLKTQQKCGCFGVGGRCVLEGGRRPYAGCSYGLPFNCSVVLRAINCRVVRRRDGQDMATSSHNFTP